MSFVILGASRAKLFSQKSKGMPRILFSLDKLVDGAAGEAMAHLSLELFKEFKDVQSSLAEGPILCSLSADSFFGFSLFMLFFFSSPYQERDHYGFLLFRRAVYVNLLPILFNAYNSFYFVILEDGGKSLE